MARWLSVSRPHQRLPQSMGKKLAGLDWAAHEWIGLPSTICRAESAPFCRRQTDRKRILRQNFPVIPIPFPVRPYAESEFATQKPRYGKSPPGGTVFPATCDSRRCCRGTLSGARADIRVKATVCRRWQGRDGSLCRCGGGGIRPAELLRPLLRRLARHHRGTFTPFLHQNTAPSPTRFVQIQREL